MSRVLFTIFCLSSLFAPIHNALSAVSEWNRNDHVDMRLISAIEAVGEQGTLPLGLQFRMKPGWKLYWRSPGDAGFPPRLTWDDSKNIATIRIHWPAPKRFSVFELETLGYTDEVILPLTAKLKRAGVATTLRATVHYLTCKDICIPYVATAELPLAAGIAAATPLAYEIERYRARVPEDGDRHGFAIQGIQLSSVGKNVEVQVLATAREPFVAPDVFVEGPEASSFGKPEVRLSNDGHQATIIIPGAGLKKSARPDGVPLIITLVDGDRMLEKSAIGKPRELSNTIPIKFTESRSILVILLLALIGGLILNFMPCVLPVLSLKLLSVIGNGGRNTRKVRHDFIASASGIIFSFLLIAGGLVALRSVGVTIGWGIHFQQPIFLVAMTLIVISFASNLFGLFEIVLPNTIANRVGSAGNSHTLTGHFLTGAFATLMATPCSAPFLGTAVGFALSRGPIEIFGIFFVLGLGLSLPYLLVAAIPQLATQMPRPGKWMIWIRYLLGLTLMATGIWLLIILNAQIGSEDTLIIAAMVALVFVVLAAKRLVNSRVGYHANKLTALIAVAALIAGGLAAERENGNRALNNHWKTFNKDELQRVIASGKTVFVDVTADWCLTCQLNKNLVLDAAPIASWLESDGVVAMKADWTRPDPAIAAYLASFGRYGIPFNAVYGPDAPNGIALPELLTSGIVAEMSSRANARSTLANHSN